MGLGSWHPAVVTQEASGRPPSITDYPVHTRDKIRYGDTDRQGHVNNAIFASFLETGRVEVLLRPESPMTDDGCAFVIARLSLDFKAELKWPGEVIIGTRVARIGRSSIGLEQSIFQDEVWAASAETVIVQVEGESGRSSALSQATILRLKALLGPGDGA
ncbi:MAG: thioesterase family protein [Myxococcota bacterium]